MVESDISIDPVEASDRIFDTVLDIRAHAESTPTIPGAVFVRSDALLDAPQDFIDNKTDTLLVVCDIGMRSLSVVRKLRTAGYEGAVSLGRGIKGWNVDGLRMEVPAGLTQEEFARYDRQLKLPGFGISGQQRLGEARVAIVGVGGLGSAVLSYLVGSGVGAITIVDSDAVEEANLHRQTIYTTSDTGRQKVTAAQDFAKALNPVVEITTVAARLDDTNALDILRSHDVVVTCTDSFAATHAINSAAVALGIPMVFGSVYRTDGQFGVFDATVGPCYACVFPEEDSGADLDCSIVGVLGTVTGAIGTIQATEAIKVLSGFASPRIGVLGLYDGLEQTIEALNIRKNSACRVCGTID